MESLFPIIRKYDFPKSVTEALRIVHIQCEKMSKNSLSISQELNQITGKTFYLYCYILHLFFSHFLSQSDFILVPNHIHTSINRHGHRTY